MGRAPQRRRRPGTWGAVLALACASCGSDGGGEAPQGAAPPSPEELDSATYVGVLDEPVTLERGEWEGEPSAPGGASRSRVSLSSHLRLTGNVDGEPGDEAVALLTESSGGSGTYVYLAVVGRRAGEPVNLATAPLGDRVQIRSARVRDGRIELDVVQTGPEDAACCPSQKVTRVWSLAPEGLVEGEARVTGTLSLADLQGVEWLLTHLAWDEPAPGSPEVTLVFGDGGVSGSSGCNRYFGTPTEGEQPGDLAFGALGGTRMACPPHAMQLESRTLSALGRVVKFGFVDARLALTWKDDAGSLGTLLFAPRPPAGSPR